MKVSEVMTPGVETVTPEQPIREAAQFMLRADAGAMPVSDGDRILGMVTDRDIAVRAVAEGRGPDTPVREVMTEGALFCFDDQDVDDVALTMGDAQVRRMPVLSRQGEKLVGIISLGDLTKVNDEGQAAEAALTGVSQEGGEHNQSQES